jgi:hypothetical protein
MKAKRILFSIAGGALLFVLLVAITWSLSMNFPAEGADTPMARRVDVLWSWSFYVVDTLRIDGLLGTAFILGLPILAYSAIIFAVLSTIGIPRHKNTR